MVSFDEVQKNILITGATGLLGVPLALELKRRGLPIITHGNRRPADFQVDLLDREKTKAMLRDTCPQSIINLMACTDVDLCERDPCLTERMNVESVQNIVDWIASERPRCHLVHLSSDQLYDGNGPSTEFEVHCVNRYAASKFRSEGFTSRIGATNLRTNFFGKSEVNGRISLTDWIYESLSGGRLTSFFTDIFFTPVSIDTLIGAIAKVIESPQSGTFNVGSRDGMSKAEFARHFAERVSLPFGGARLIKSDQAGQPKLVARRPKDMRMDSSLFQSTFAFNLPTLREEIDLVSWDYMHPILK